LRIVAGLWRGKTLTAPKDARVRPTTDRVREALFNVLAHGNFGRDTPLPQGARVLDLYAGTGALGLEALSRGALTVTFVDDHAESRALIRRNIEALGATGTTRLMRRDASNLGPLPAGNQAGGPFDLVFLDPPYGQGLVGPTLDAAMAGGWLAPGAVAVAEMDKSHPAPEVSGLDLIQSRDYGETRLALYRRG